MLQVVIALQGIKHVLQQQTRTVRQNCYRTTSNCCKACACSKHRRVASLIAMFRRQFLKSLDSAVRALVGNRQAKTRPAWLPKRPSEPGIFHAWWLPLAALEHMPGALPRICPNCIYLCFPRVVTAKFAESHQHAKGEAFMSKPGQISYCHLSSWSLKVTIIRAKIPATPEQGDITPLANSHDNIKGVACCCHGNNQQLEYNRVTDIALSHNRTWHGIIALIIMIIILTLSSS